MRLAPFVLVLAVGGLPACAGSESDFLSDPPPSTASAATIAPVVPDAPVATSVAIPPTQPITVPEPIAVPEPPTTPAASIPIEAATTVPAGPPTEPEARAAMDFLYAEWYRCSFDPANCDSSTFTVEGTPFAINVDEGHQEWAASGTYVEGHPETWYSVEEIVELAPGLTKVRVCYVDYGWLREANDTPQHDDDVVLDDRIKAYRSEAILRLASDGRYLFESYHRLAVWARETSCPAA